MLLHVLMLDDLWRADHLLALTMEPPPPGVLGLHIAVGSSLGPSKNTRMSLLMTVLHKRQISDINTSVFPCVLGTRCPSRQKMGDCVPLPQCWQLQPLKVLIRSQDSLKLFGFSPERDLKNHLVQTCHLKNEKTSAKEVVRFIKYSQHVGPGDFKVDIASGNKEIRVSMKF